MKGIRKKWRGLTKKRKRITIVVTALVICAGVGGFVAFRFQTARPVMAADYTATEVTAETGTISNTIVGTGNLASDSAVSVKIPSGIVVDEVKVESGDQVSKGDTLATADMASVYQQMESVQEKIEDLDAEINESKDDSNTDTISSKVDGRVKKIYGEEEDQVADVMLENGALLLLSIDGKMALEFQSSEAVAKGDTVVVQLSDNTQKKGTVESVSGKTCTVTFSDKYADVDEEVTVYTEDETELGKGSAYIHQELAVTGTAGTIEEVSVSKNEAVSSGTELFVLENDGTTVEYREQMAAREAYAATLQKLILISQTGTITADRDGTIESVLVSDSGEDSSDSTDTQTESGNKAQVSNMSWTYGENSYSGTGVHFLTLAAAEGSTEYLGEQAGNAEMPASENGQDVSGETTDGQNGTDQQPNGDNTQSPDGTTQKEDTKLQLTVVSQGTGNAQTLVLITPVKDGIPQTSIEVSDNSYTGTISWNPQSSSFAAASSYQAQVVLTAGDGYIFGADSILKVEVGVLSGLTVSQDQKTLSFSFTFPETEGEEQPSQTPSDNQQTNQEQQTAGTGTSLGAGVSGGGSSGGSVSGASISGGGQSQTSVSSQTGISSTDQTLGDDSTSTEYSTDIAAFTISGNDQMLLSVNVDELDINSVSLDQEAEVTFDALEDQTFSGIVVKIGNSASVSGGVAKYSVEISVPKTEEMKVGMNASATIVIEQKENVVTIPVNAIQERGEETFVYTEQDEEGNLSGEQQVTTGLSDGTTVEITEGLSEGDTVYYQKTGNTDSFNQTGGGMMPDMMGGGSGDGERGFGGMEQGDFQGGGMGTPPGM